MLAMPEINHIKKLRNIKSLSINEIAKRTGFCWSTVKKYADEDQLPTESNPIKRGMMYDEDWGEIVSDWLMVLTSSRNPQFLPISFPQILPDKIRHFS